ncbi:MAG: NAD-binding protein [Candidatus Lokiarchaeota archaeon]|nr:NAD-binding protein [Candidatus Lokiarchaeota archaeon]
MNLVKSLINIQLKIREYKAAFIFLFFFWFMGFLTFFFTETNEDLLTIFFISLGIRSSTSGGDFAGFYSLMWPILLEVIVFGFIIGELLEKYNPIITSKILSKHKNNHTIIIGYQHLSLRIIEHCIKTKHPFVIIEDDGELVEDLINSGHPVVVGDATESSNLEYANVKHAKEVFLCINDVRIAIICTEKIRELNKSCPIYVRVFEDHIQEYLKNPPLNAHPFSISKWAMKEVINWTENKKGKAIVIGRDYLTQSIAHHISLQPERDVYFFNDEHDGIVYKENPQLHIINECACFLSDLREHVKLEEITQVFICWKRDSEFDDSLYLTSKLYLRYPDIEVYLRIFDDELISLIKRYNAKTFSSSSSAFKLLQKEVRLNSAIFPKLKR